MPGATVDGMNVLAVRKEAKTCIERARSGEGPTFLVCNTYRFLGHGRNPDTNTYRTKEEERSWKEECPITSFRGKLVKQGLMTEVEDRNLEKAINKKIYEAIKFAEESPCPKVEDIEEDIYA